MAAMIGVIACQSQGGFTCPVVDATSVALSDVTTNSAALKWGAVPHATSYRVHFHAKNVADSSWTDRDAEMNNFKLINLMPATTYEFTIQTVCGSSGLNVSEYTRPFQKFTTLP